MWAIKYGSVRASGWGSVTVSGQGFLLVGCGLWLWIVDQSGVRMGKGGREGG